MVQRVSLESQWQYGEEEEWRLSAASRGATDGPLIGVAFVPLRARAPLFFFDLEIDLYVGDAPRGGLDQPDRLVFAPLLDGLFRLVLAERAE